MRKVELDKLEDIFMQSLGFSCYKLKIYFIYVFEPTNKTLNCGKWHMEHIAHLSSALFFLTRKIVTKQNAY
jgi:hypothetical protein